MVIVSLEWKKKKEKNWHQPPGDRGGKEELFVVGQEALRAKRRGRGGMCVFSGRGVYRLLRASTPLGYV